jgi:hypothetical protein
MLAKGGHDMVHERFCVELMVCAIEEIYDEGAQAVRFPAGIPAAVGAAR